MAERDTKSQQHPPPQPPSANRKRTVIGSVTGPTGSVEPATAAHF
jgi:hypothetical protein